MVILISGTINSGKTTCARKLVRYLGRAAIVEVDAFFKFFPRAPVATAGEESLWVAAAAIRRLVERGYRVVVPYPLWQKDLDLLQAELTPQLTDIHLITLVPETRVVLGTRSKRKNKDWERQVVAWHRELGVQTPARGRVIDNSQQAPMQTVRQMLEYIRSGAALIQRRSSAAAVSGRRRWQPEPRPSIRLRADRPA